MRPHAVLSAEKFARGYAAHLGSGDVAVLDESFRDRRTELHAAMADGGPRGSAHRGQHWTTEPAPNWTIPLDRFGSRLDAVHARGDSGGT